MDGMVAICCSLCPPVQPYSPSPTITPHHSILHSSLPTIGAATQCPDSDTTGASLPPSEQHTVLIGRSRSPDTILLSDWSAGDSSLTRQQPGNALPLLF